MQEFLTGQSVDITLGGFLVNLLITGVLSYLLGWVYIAFGKTLSDRRAFARNFVVLGMTTMLMITVVKSSLALSLGLVGALSIVRFRAAIKEPEELGYLFLVIALGLGFGANQRAIASIAFMIILLVIWLSNLRSPVQEDRNLQLTVSSRVPSRASLEAIRDVLERHCARVRLKRFEETEESLDMSFVVELAAADGLQAAAVELRALDESLSVRLFGASGRGG